MSLADGSVPIVAGPRSVNLAARAASITDLAGVRLGKPFQHA
jgi:hypothetical protein